MLGEDFGIGAFKWPHATEPFVDDDAERVLIAGGTCLGLDLFWSHVRDCANGYLRAHRRGTVGSRSNAEIAEQDIIALTNEHIFGFDIAVNELLVVSILQGVSSLLHIGDNSRERNRLALGVSFSQCAMSTIVHHQEWDAVTGDIKVQHAHDVRMYKLGDCLSLLLKALDLFI